MSTQELDFEKDAVPIQLQQASAEVELFRGKVESALPKDSIWTALLNSAGLLVEGAGEGIGSLLVAGIGEALQVLAEYMQRNKETDRAIRTQQWHEVEQRLLARVSVWEEAVTRTFNYYSRNCRAALEQFASGGRDGASLREELDRRFSQWEQLLQQTSHELLVIPLQNSIRQFDSRYQALTEPASNHQRGTAKAPYVQVAPVKFNPASFALTAPRTWLGEQMCSGYDSMRDQVHALQAEIAAHPGDSAKMRRLEELDGILTGQLDAMIELSGRVMLVQEQIFPSVMDDVDRVVEEFMNSVDQRLVPRAGTVPGPYEFGTLQASTTEVGITAEAVRSGAEIVIGIAKMLKGVIEALDALEERDRKRNEENWTVIKRELVRTMSSWEKATTTAFETYMERAYKELSLLAGDKQGCATTAKNLQAAYDGWVARTDHLTRYKVIGALNETFEELRLGAIIR